LNVSGPPATDRVGVIGAFVTLSVTLTVCVPFEAPGAENETEPVYVPTLSAVGLTLMATLDEFVVAVPLLGLTCNHED
jgi:hypothetical protein